MIRDKHGETFDSPSLPPRARGAVTAPSFAFHLLVTVWLLISSIISAICCWEKGKVPRRHSHNLKVFNLTACGVMMACDECRGGLRACTESVTSDWAGLRKVCGCQDSLVQMSGS